MSDALADTILRHLQSLGYTINRTTYLGSGRCRLTAWRVENSDKDGMYAGGAVWRAEADDRYAAAVELALQLGVELAD